MADPSKQQPEKSFKEWLYAKYRIIPFEIGIILLLALLLFNFLALKRWIENEAATVVFDIVVITIVFVIIRWKIHLITDFIKKYGKYFIISILYIVILGLFLAKTSQIDALIVDLFDYDSRNSLLLFALFQFPFSIMIVWFLPFYLLFSEKFYRPGSNLIPTNKPSEDSDRLAYFYNIFFPVKTIFHPRGKSKTVDDEFKEFVELDKKFDLFHRIRRLLGGLYIVTLIFLIENILIDIQYIIYEWRPAIIISALVLLLFYALIIPIETYKKDFELKVRLNQIIKKIENFDIGLSLGGPIIIFVALFLLFEIWYYLSFGAFNVIVLAIFLLFIIGLDFVFKDKLKNDEIENFYFNKLPKLDKALFVRKHGSFILISIIVTGILFPVFIYSMDSGEEPITVFYNLRSYLIINIMFLVAFLGFSYYRRFERSYDFPNIKSISLNFWYKLIDEVFTPLLMLVNLFLAVIFLVFFLGSLFDFSGIVASHAKDLNPINIFFFAFNGLFALLALFLRGLKLNEHRRREIVKDRLIDKINEIQKQYKSKFNQKSRALKRFDKVCKREEEPPKENMDPKEVIDPKDELREFRKELHRLDDELERLKDKEGLKNIDFHVIQKDIKKLSAPGLQKYWLVAFLGLLFIGLYFYNKGNKYHTLQYYSHHFAQSGQNSLMPLRIYTDSFLHRRETSSKPIYIIASDGGGLKAAYWTMLVMKELETKAKIDFNKDVFLTSGSSGGSIGLGMYTYLKGLGLRDSVIKDKIDAIGEGNFLSTDFAGFLTRWPIKALPGSLVKEVWPDRMDVMAKNYIEIAQDTSSDKYDSLKYERIESKPFAALWTQNNYKLPLFVANTAQMEQGIRAFAHPLKPDANLTKGFIDLSSQKGENDKTEYISFPDALFTSNRFPVLSPMAKISEHGHFFDGGAFDNSGIGTILQFLQYMKSQEDQETIYKEFFKRDIVLLSIRCDKTRYIYDEFGDLAAKFPQIKNISYINALVSAVSEDGMTGVPLYFDAVLKDESWKKNFGIHSMEPICLPFFIKDKEDVSDAMERAFSEEVSSVVKDKFDSLNQNIIKAYGDSIILDPPLGRFLAKPSRVYMDSMSKMVVKQKFLSKPLKGSKLPKPSNE